MTSTFDLLLAAAGIEGFLHDFNDEGRCRRVFPDFEEKWGPVFDAILRVKADRS